MNWFDNSQASYVLAAYGVAAVALFGVLAASLYAARKYATILKTMKADTKAGHDA